MPEEIKKIDKTHREILCELIKSGVSFQAIERYIQRHDLPREELTKDNIWPPKKDSEYFLTTSKYRIPIKTLSKASEEFLHKFIESETSVQTIERCTTEEYTQKHELLRKKLADMAKKKHKEFLHKLIESRAGTQEIERYIQKHDLSREELANDNIWPPKKDSEYFLITDSRLETPQHIKNNNSPIKKPKPHLKTHKKLKIERKSTKKNQGIEIVVKLTRKEKKQLIINLQTPPKQIWMSFMPSIKEEEKKQPNIAHKTKKTCSQKIKNFLLLIFDFFNFFCKTNKKKDMPIHNSKDKKKCNSNISTKTDHTNTPKQNTTIEDAQLEKASNKTTYLKT